MFTQYRHGKEARTSLRAHLLYQQFCFFNKSLLGRFFFINCITNISNKNLGSAGGTKIKIKSVVPLRDEKRN